MLVLAIALLGIGFGFGYMVLRATIPVAGASDSLMRPNYRGVPVAVVGGLPIVIVSVCGLVLMSVLWSFKDGPMSGGIAFLGEDSGRLVIPAALAILITAFFGLLDDAIGTAAAKGIRGHLRSLIRGRITTGLLKLAAGLGASLVVATMLDNSALWIICGAITMAAWTNVGNLFDLGPGRCIKFCLPVAVLLIVFFSSRLAPLALVVGAAAAVLPADLSEKVMLGDTGSNTLGVLTGICIVGSGNHGIVLAGLGVGVALNLVAERSSFSKIIASNKLLNSIDLAGATTERRSYINGQK